MADIYDFILNIWSYCFILLNIDKIVNIASASLYFNIL